MMRLKSLEISGFRAFPGIQRFDLDADAIVVTGPNGTGKTSLFDSILWALTGRLRRIELRGGDVLSLYSKSGQARVAISLGDAETGLRIVRTFDGNRSHLVVESDARTLEGQSAEVKLLESLWPAALATADPYEVFDTTLTRSVYLQQDLVREFLESDSHEARFQVVSELVGAGRLGELQQDLERARNAWTRARTDLERRTQSAQKTVEQLRSRLERLAREAPQLPEELQREWSQWWKDVQALGLSSDEPEMGSSKAPSNLSQTLQVLQAERRSLERRLSAAASFLSEIREQPEMSQVEVSEFQEAKALVNELEGKIKTKNKDLAQAQAQAAEERRHQTELKETQEEIRALASLALRHLEERCPICKQEYDRPGTKARLETIVESSREIMATPATEAARNLAAELSILERETVEARTRLTQLESRARVAEEWRMSLSRRLEELGIVKPPSDLQETIRKLEGDLDTTSIETARLYAVGEQLAVSLARASELAQREDLETQLGSAQRELSTLEGQLAAHNRTREVASQLLEGTRDAGHEAVAIQVGRIEPLVERIYARIDPHPGFTQVKLSTALYRRRGQVSTVVTDPRAALIDLDPLPVLSSSQLNALAVSVFLGLNLGVPSLPLPAALLDDPLQSLDDVNLLGLVDTLRRTKALRQLIISTHDPRFAGLLQRKLRPVGDEERTIIIRFEDWTREGPTVSQTALSPEPIDYRVAAA